MDYSPIVPVDGFPATLKDEAGTSSTNEMQALPIGNRSNHQAAPGMKLVFFRGQRDAAGREMAEDLASGGMGGNLTMRGPLFLVLLLLAGCDDRPGEWAAIVYPDRTDRTKFDVTPRFKTFEYCREAAIERMNSLQINKGGAYECGYKCDLSGDPHRMNVCEETRK